MPVSDILEAISKSHVFQELQSSIYKSSGFYLQAEAKTGSFPAFLTAALSLNETGSAPLDFCLVADGYEDAAYLFNDLESLIAGMNGKRDVHFLSASSRLPYSPDEPDSAALHARNETLGKLRMSANQQLLVTYSEAIFEKVVTHKELSKNTFEVVKGQTLSVDFIIEFLQEYAFVRTEFVYEPGQYAVRGGIVDVFSYAHDLPLRIEFFGDEVETIRTFDPVSQLSEQHFKSVLIMPDISLAGQKEYTSIMEFMPQRTVFLFMSAFATSNSISSLYESAFKSYEEALKNSSENIHPSELYIDEQSFIAFIQRSRIVDFSHHTLLPAEKVLSFGIKPQPSFNKNFDLLIGNLKENHGKKIRTILFSDTPKQVERIESILCDITGKKDISELLSDYAALSIHQGFIDEKSGIACYTDHQVFDRYHRYRIRSLAKAGKEASVLKELSDLSPGDYVSHIDHGIGIFAGLEKIDVNGKQQEAIRLVYRDSDILYVSIHALHKISRYSSSEGKVPSINKLGSNAWSSLKNKTKKKVKELAYDLVKLYARRKAVSGVAYDPDNYLQAELEASFVYEDTPDQEKATAAVKKDMEAAFPMDRLICGDVGFGKTEIAVRAAFKAVCSSKQVALLVPTTILAMQHHKTFTERLKELPANVEYINRFKSAKEQKEILEKLKLGKIDIIIGTHKLLGKEVVFKDLGLLIIDEEQKFGVSAKDKIKTLRTHVDTLTLTATPIPRTLQFSMMGARDLSIIATPPPNRYPVKTTVHPFDENLIKEAIQFELSRGGQVFFIHNRVKNIQEIAGFVQRLVPKAVIGTGHGQMEGEDLEKVMLDFVEGRTDILISTSIIESGLDISNANTIIINEAHHFGLSDLHQMRGRVGRSNKKAFCYLLAPPLSTLTSEAKRRLKTLEEFSDLGSGFQIALRDLDIRGAGNLLGAEQSGFINEIGFDMYMKILDEAIMELREEDESFRENLTVSGRLKLINENAFVRDCQVDTDLEVLIPDDYVADISERLLLYRELDELSQDDELEAFVGRLRDRFGPPPSSVFDLVETKKLRRECMRLGIEKVVVKLGKFICYFVSKSNSPYYESEVFKGVLAYVKHNPAKGRFKENAGKLYYVFEGVSSVMQAQRIVHDIYLKVIPSLPKESV
jgi:transcription-repair coupling factor (superfamily II helicase)